MYVVAVGIFDYNGESLDLKYVMQDVMVMVCFFVFVGVNFFVNGDSIEVYCLIIVLAD